MRRNVLEPVSRRGAGQGRRRGARIFSLHLFAVPYVKISRFNNGTNAGLAWALSPVSAHVPAGSLRAMSPAAPVSFCIRPLNVTQAPTSLEHRIRESILAIWNLHIRAGPDDISTLGGVVQVEPSPRGDDGVQTGPSSIPTLTRCELLIFT